MKIGDDIDTGDGLTSADDLAALDEAEERRWDDIREGAKDSIRVDGVALYASAPGVVHRVTQLSELATLTRHARRRVRARWPEDAN